ncbi:hypothetical protein MKY34_12170 [Sporosarcina sp. FSL K6-1522]|uniref:hypothetical protein n=1 Tax=Sporosarcina sp. FSL K6-1522 TaxID=2921554 RepID=UPI00315ADE5A
MEKQFINDGLDELLGADDIVMSQVASSEYEDLMVKALSPYYREYLVNRYKKLIIDCIKYDNNTHLIDEYIVDSAEAMSCSDEEIARKLKENIALKRDEVEGDYLNELFAAATLYP